MLLGVFIILIKRSLLFIIELLQIFFFDLEPCLIIYTIKRFVNRFLFKWHNEKTEE